MFSGTEPRGSRLVPGSNRLRKRGCLVMDTDFVPVLTIYKGVNFWAQLR